MMDKRYTGRIAELYGYYYSLGYDNSILHRMAELRLAQIGK
jgi:hypothetical protein